MNFNINRIEKMCIKQELLLEYTVKEIENIILQLIGRIRELERVDPRMELRFDMCAEETWSVHPQIIMETLAEKHGFKVLKAVPYPIADCWIFEIDKEFKEGELPSFLHKV